MCKWRNLGIELNLSVDELAVIKEDVQQNPVVRIATDVLGEWRQRERGTSAKRLITAIHNVGYVAYAATLKEG